MHFPEDFKAELKVSPKTECISFRYVRGKERFCFQVDFESAFSAYMAHHMMFKCGLLHPQWSDIFKYGRAQALGLYCDSIEMHDGLNFDHGTPKGPLDLCTEPEKPILPAVLKPSSLDSCKEPGRHILSAMFEPSQPLCSSRYPVSPALDFDINDDNLFTPLSFQEFGYESQAAL